MTPLRDAPGPGFSIADWPAAAVLVTVVLILPPVPSTAGPAVVAQASAGEQSDYAAAFRRNLARAHKGDAKAQFMLGLMYSEGRGTRQDYVEAHKWFDLAAASGNAVAAYSKDELAARMTAGQIAEAQTRASAWTAGDGAPPRPQTPTQPARASVPAKSTIRSGLEGISRGIASMFHSIRRPKQPQAGTVSIGIRGLGASDLAAATPDHEQLERLDALAVDAPDATEFARQAGLAKQWVAYLPEPTPPPMTSPQDSQQGRD